MQKRSIKPKKELVQVRELVKHFYMKKGVFGRKRVNVRAVDNVSFNIDEGTALGLVGESGCGKTTLGRTLLNLAPPTGGEVLFDGRDVFSLPREALRKLRSKMQIIFQDPYSSLNPRMTVGAIVSEGIKVHGLARGEEVRERTRELLRRVGLDEGCIHRYPHEFSGGQRQRIGIARALSVRPRFIVCDEPVSALDVSVQAQIINLLDDLREELNLSYLFISHDLSVVRHISDRVAVMYLGRIVEMGETDKVFNDPKHPYTRALISAVPEIDPESKKKRIILEGDVPSPSNPPTGCPFHPRCPEALDRCSMDKPPEVHLHDNRWHRCFLG